MRGTKERLGLKSLCHPLKKVFDKLAKLLYNMVYQKSKGVMFMLIKIDVLFMEGLGYGSKVWKGQATRVLQKALGIEKESAQKCFVLNEGDTKEVLMDLAKGKSNYRGRALELLNDNNFMQIKGILTEDGSYKVEKPAKKKAKKHTKADLENFLEMKNLMQEFKDWVKA
jgi:hypothetical protein